MDSLLSIVQMPAGIPVGTLAIGKAGAINAALLAAAIIGNKHAQYRAALQDFRQKQTDSVLAHSDPREGCINAEAKEAMQGVVAGDCMDAGEVL
jgi:5-(carboxyamino)imidazole ribonucleotide mutase